MGTSGTDPLALEYYNFWNISWLLVAANLSGR